MNNFFTWLAVAIALSFCALFAVPPLIDWNQYRGVFEEEVSRLLGREVRVGGRVDLRILPFPYVQFEKIRIADAPDIPGSFVRAENFTLLLSVPPLLRGVIEASEVRVDRPVLRLRFDRQGRGNWQKIRLGSQALPFIPTAVALQSADIRDGQVIVESHQGEILAHLKEITGELAASSLHGPYRFNGDAVISDTRLSVRLATAAMGENGNIVMTATATNRDTGAKNYIKGQLNNLQLSPNFKGELSAQAPLAFMSKAGEVTTRYDLRSNLSIDHQAAELSNIAVSLDSKGRQQKINGQIKANWQDKLTVAGRLQSSWLDIDALTGGHKRRAPYKILELLAGNMAASRTSVRASRIDVSVAQARLGGEIISGLSADIYRTEHKMRVERLSMNLPGRTQLRMDAQLPTGLSKPRWQGHVLMKGNNFNSFANWLSPDSLSVRGTAEGAFEFSSQAAFSPGDLEFSNAHISLAGVQSDGLFRYNWMKKKPQITLDWSAKTLDVSGFGKNILSNKNLAYVMGFDTVTDQDGQPSHLSKFLRSADIDLRLNTNHLNDERRVFKDIDINLVRKAGRIRFGKSRLAIEPELGLEFEGNLEAIHSKQRNWKLKGFVSAKSDRAMNEVDDFLKLITKGFELPQNIRAVYPLDVAFYANSHATAGQRRSMLEADGTMREHRLRLSAITGGELHRWPDNTLQLDIKLDGKTGKHVPALPAEPTSASSNTTQTARDLPFYLRLNISGIPRRQLKASATLASQAWHLSMQADSQAAADGKAISWTGTGGSQTADIKSLVHFFAPSWARLFPSSASAGGQFEFAMTRNNTAQNNPGQSTWTFEPADFQIAGSSVSGALQLTFAATPSNRPSLTGSATVNQFHGGMLAQTLLFKNRSLSAGQNQALDTKPDATAVNATKPFWPNRTFDLAALDWLDIDLSVSAERFKLANGLDLKDTRLHVANTSEALTLKVLDGALLGGKATGTAKMANAASGVKTEGFLEIQDVRIASLISPLLPTRDDGRISVQLAASGQALSPYELIKTLQGTGAAKINNFQLRGLKPASLTEIADYIILGEKPPEELTDYLNEAFTREPVRLKNQSIDLTLERGKVRIGQLDSDIAEKNVKNQTVVDLKDLSVDSRWRLGTVLQRSLEPDIATQPLPSLQIIYKGSLESLGEIRPELNFNDLQRELTVRRMEYDVRRLERLRREDEERARQEAERLRQLELEKQQREQQELERQKALEEARLKQIETQQSATGAKASSPDAATTGTQTRPRQPAGSRKPPSDTKAIVVKETLPPISDSVKRPAAAAASSTQPLVAPAPQLAKPRSNPPASTPAKSTSSWDTSVAKD